MFVMNLNIGELLMTNNIKQTSAVVAHLAATTLNDPHASATAKSLAASLVAQTNTDKQTGALLENTASKVLQSEKYSSSTKTLAASVLSQSNKKR